MTDATQDPCTALFDGFPATAMRDTEQRSLRFARCSFAMNGALNGPLAKGLLAAGMDDKRH